MSVEEFAERARATQQAVNNLGAGPPSQLTPAQRALLVQMETPGSVLYGILAWMSDSMMLARLRPVFMDLMADALERECEFPEGGGDCRALTDTDDTERSDWCAACILHDAVDRIQRVTRPPLGT